MLLTHLEFFQSVCCGLTMNFTIRNGEFVQILHTGQSQWLNISTIGTKHPVVHVYDSMYPSASTTVKAQVAVLLHTTFPSVQLNFMGIQMQSGGADCGVFAVAFATSLALGKAPGQFHFDQPRIRQHLFKCLKSRKMVMFPHKKLRRAIETHQKCLKFIVCVECQFCINL